MPLIVDTLDDESFDSLDEAGERADGTGLSLREALALGTDDVVTFDAALTGATLVPGAHGIGIARSVTIDGDLDNDGTADIRLLNMTGAGVFGFNPALDQGILTLEGLIVESDASGTDEDVATTIRLNVGSISLVVSSSTLTSRAAPGIVGDQSRTVAVSAHGVAIENLSGGLITSEGRFGIAVFAAGDGLISMDTRIENAGTIEAPDDAIRIATGSINNHGTIQSLNTYDAAGLDPAGIDSVGIYTENLAPGNSPNVAIVNFSDGVITGARAGIEFNSSGSVTNSGLVESAGNAIRADDLFAEASEITIDNTGGTIRRTGGHLLDSGSSAAISVDGDIYATIANTGLIESADTALYLGFGNFVQNGPSGVIRADSDGTGDDGIAFRAPTKDDFAIEAFFSAPTLLPSSSFVSAQNISFTFSREIVTEVGTFPQTNSQTPVAFLNVSAPVIVPLIDLEETVAQGHIVFVYDEDGLVFPASIEVPTAEHGILTVQHLGGSSFNILDAEGNPAFAIPDTDATDVLINEGEIIGDVFTGLGDDNVLNFGLILGTVDLGLGDDIFTGGDGDDTVYADEGADGIIGGGGNDMLDGGAGDDQITGGDGADLIIGGDGNDLLVGDGGI